MCSILNLGVAALDGYFVSLVLRILILCGYLLIFGPEEYKSRVRKSDTVKGNKREVQFSCISFSFDMVELKSA